VLTSPAAAAPREILNLKETPDQVVPDDLAGSEDDDSIDFSLEEKIIYVHPISALSSSKKKALSKKKSRGEIKLSRKKKKDKDKDKEKGSQQHSPPKQPPSPSATLNHMCVALLWFCSTVARALSSFRR